MGYVYLAIPFGTPPMNGMGYTSNGILDCTQQWGYSYTPITIDANQFVIDGWGDVFRCSRTGLIFQESDKRVTDRGATVGAPFYTAPDVDRPIYPSWGGSPN